MSGWYKVLDADNLPAHGGARGFAWPLPSDDGPGAWTPELDGVSCCRRGYHLTRRPMDWPVVGMRVYEAEGAGATDGEGDPDGKSAFARARLLREAPEAVPPWWRAVEAFVRDEVPAVPYLQPDGDPDPAWVLVERPTWLAARDAAWHAASGAARVGAWGAARDAARDAAWHAAGKGARDAAWDAAWEGAWAAARDAAWHAASGAAGEAAGDAALVCVVRAFDRVGPEHAAHAEARWRVWRKGYALLCDVDGKLVVYAARP